MGSVIRGDDNFDSLIHQGIGVNQTWQNVTASRSSGVTYTNSTGKPIYIIPVTTASTSVVITGIVNGTTMVDIGFSASSARPAVFFIVPNGATYSINISGASLSVWYELR